MKHSLLAVVVGSIILAGCNSSSSDDPTATSTDVRAFDGPIQGMTGQFECLDGSKGDISETDYDGYSTIENETFVESPDTCSITFNKTPGAIDTSNGKDMSEVSYSVPKGLLKAGNKIAATPFTTIIAKQLGDELYSEEVAKEVLVKIGIDVDTLNNGGVDIDVTELLTDPETSLKKLKETSAEVYSKVMVSTVVLSDALVAQGNNSDISVDQLANATKVLSQSIQEKHPNYPQSGSNADKEIFIDLSEVLEDAGVFDVLEENNVDLNEGILADIIEGEEVVIPPRPVTPTDPTGGTGGTGGSGSAGGAGA